MSTFSEVEKYSEVVDKFWEGSRPILETISRRQSRPMAGLGWSTLGLLLREVDAYKTNVQNKESTQKRRQKA